MSSPAKSRIVPFRRVLRKGDIGDDVLAVKRALRHAAYYVLPQGQEMTRQFGDRMQTAVRRFQQKNELTVDGIYGILTHRKLMQHFDSYGAYLMGRVPTQTSPAVNPRALIVAEATWSYNNRGAIHYAQIRPMPSLNMGHRLPQTDDCSGSCTAWFRRASVAMGGGGGIPDPNGPQFNYNGYGYTGSLSVRGQLVSTNQARPGDLVFYGGGGWPYHHVALYVGFGRCISHGSESGPSLVPLDYRGDRCCIRSYLL